MGRGGMRNDRRNPRKHHEAIFVLIQREFDVRMRFLTSYNMPLLERSGG